MTINSKVCFLLVIFGNTFLFFNCKRKVTSEVIRVSNQLYLRRLYYPDGKIMIERELNKYSDDSFIANGFYKRYYKDGKLNELAFYKKGIQDSLLLTYNNQGILIRKDYRLFGQFTGLQYDYYDNGKLKSEAFAIDDTTKLLLVKYGLKGNIEQIQGQLIFGSPSDNNSNLVGKEFVFVNNLAILNNCKGILDIKIMGNANNLIKDTTLEKFKHFKNIDGVLFTYKFNNKGDYLYKAVFTIIDTILNKQIAQDSLLYTIKIK